jgi:hypothetical protein
MCQLSLKLILVLGSIHPSGFLINIAAIVMKKTDIAAINDSVVHTP